MIENGPSEGADGRDAVVGIDALDRDAALAFAAERRAASDRAEAQLLAAAAHWADLHPVLEGSEPDGYASEVLVNGVEQLVPLAGEGTPLVAEFAPAEFAATLAMSTDAGRKMIGEALELRHRLPKTWARIMSGDLPAWRGRRIAERTTWLCPDAAGYVDGQLAPFAHKLSVGRIDKLVEAAAAEFQPDEAKRRAEAAAEHRHVRVEDDQSLNGTTRIDIEADTLDALAFDNTIGAIADQYGALGDSDSLDVRRAKAVGQIADPQSTLDLLNHDGDAADGTDSSGDEQTRPATVSRRPTRGRSTRLVVYLHLHEAAVTGQITTGDPGQTDTADTADSGATPQRFSPLLGRREHSRGDRPVLVEQIRAWVGRDDVSVSIQPVIDLNESIHADSYEIPHRLLEQVRLRDRSCVFPWCERPASRCDTDHVVPYPRAGDQPDGETGTDNLAPLCRRHHRHKTHGRWSYLMLEPGIFLWTSPHSQHYLRDHTGTRIADPGQSKAPDVPDAHPPDQ